MTISGFQTHRLSSEFAVKLDAKGKTWKKAESFETLR